MDIPLQWIIRSFLFPRMISQHGTFPGNHKSWAKLVMNDISSLGNLECRSTLDINNTPNLLVYTDRIFLNFVLRICVYYFQQYALSIHSLKVSIFINCWVQYSLTTSSCTARESGTCMWPCRRRARTQWRRRWSRGRRGPRRSRTPGSSWAWERRASWFNHANKDVRCR